MQKPVKILLGATAVIIVLIIMVIIVLQQRNGPIPVPGLTEVGYVDMDYTEKAAQDYALSAITGSRGEEVYIPTAVPNVDDGLAAVDTTERLIIKTGTFSMVVDDVGLAVSAISDYASQNGGFLVSSNIYRSGVAPYATVVIRIPADKFDAGLSEFQKMGEVTSESVDGQDVTEEYVDLEARLNTWKATEESLLGYLQKAVEIEDILAVHQELTYVRQEIERLEGRMKYLRTSAELSTITVHLSTDPEALPVVDEEDKWRPLGELKDALRSLLDVAKSLSYVVIWIIVYIPVWIGLALLGYIVYRIIKRVLKGKKTQI